jgi:hypothetical protein
MSLLNCLNSFDPEIWWTHPARESRTITSTTCRLLIPEALNLCTAFQPVVCEPNHAPIKQSDTAGAFCAKTRLRVQTNYTVRIYACKMKMVDHLALIYWPSGGVRLRDIYNSTRRRGLWRHYILSWFCRLSKPIPAQLAYLHWSSGHDFRLSRVKSLQARETRVRFPDGEQNVVFVLACQVISSELETGSHIQCSVNRASTDGILLHLSMCIYPRGSWSPLSAGSPCWNYTSIPFNNVDWSVTCQEDGMNFSNSADKYVFLYQQFQSWFRSGTVSANLPQCGSSIL